MEIEQPAVPRPRRSPAVRRVLIASVMACAVLGGAPTLMRYGREQVVPPGPVARAGTAVSGGVPAALTDLAAFIADRESYLRSHPRDARAWALLGAAYADRGKRTSDAQDFPRAERALWTSLTVRRRGNTEALGGLAVLANARGDHRAAKQWAEAAVRSAPTAWTAYPALIEAYDGLGDHKAVGRTLDKLLALEHGPSAMTAAARVYWARGWRDDAAAMLSDAAARAEGAAERAADWERAGELAWERGEPGEALRYFETAERTDPGGHAALAGQGRALAALGRTREALEAYGAALVEQPSPGYALELGELYQSLGYQDHATAQYDLVRERGRKDAAVGVDDAVVLGLLEADHGEPAAGVRLLRQEWRRQPGVRVADALGWALHRAGQNREALGYATRATDREPSGGVRSALYAYHRGQIERALRRTGPARRHLGEALRINPHFSPLLAPVARDALGHLGEPSEEGPWEDFYSY
ncbi:hypothetical protein AAW14_31275 [Streptomyces hygroscopicus]|uniref:tetratricopeptide repeat protein n=1 Tax=Streptomyces hygroscopicus TaxID=1912 RepID=UPI00223FC44C|nr:tetratricopeptide repeat protein [Streptomyces hygroscopicus]MCW7946351.1 hypothetical protein [Streptomyces hygroscopicus]